MTDDQLKDLFSQAGAVDSASVLMDKMTGRSRGFGFVEMADEDSQNAIDKLNGQEVEGRKLIVNEARPMADRPPRRGGFGGGGNRGGGGYGGGGYGGGGFGGNRY